MHQNDIHTGIEFARAVAAHAMPTLLATLPAVSATVHHE